MNIEIVGIYSVYQQSEVKLIELLVDGNSDLFDPGQITQEQIGIPKMNWQVAYDECYLDLGGEKLIVEQFDKPDNINKFRVAFFFHFLDFTMPLLTQAGAIDLIDESIMPTRLNMIMSYEDVD